MSCESSMYRHGVLHLRDWGILILKSSNYWGEEYFFIIWGQAHMGDRDNGNQKRGA